jgi:glutathione S-transferase
MAEFTLYLGNKAYSSWSLRGWLACKVAGIQFEEVVRDMAAPDWPAFVRSISPTAKVPVLRHGDRVIWESLSIVEYLAEIRPAAGLWPAEPAARAHARSISSEMHAGFIELRRAMWMNMRRRFPGKGRTPGALADIGRISAMWHDTLTRFGAGGPFLFGPRLTAADVMYAPVVTRFITWKPELSVDTIAYVKAVWEHPFMVDWRNAAEVEPWITAKYETPGS